MNLLCKIGLHDWLIINSYTGSSESGYETTGQVKKCCRCGKKTKSGSAHYPKHWV